jgi:hypothetical protein
MLIGLEFDGQGSDVIVKVPVLGDLPGQTPVFGAGDGGLQDLEVASGPCEHVVGPGGQGFDGRVGAVVGLCVEVNNVGLFVRPLHVGIPRDGSIIIEFDPLGGVIECVPDRDVEVRDLAVVRDIPCWWLIEGSLIVEDTLLQGVDLLFILLNVDYGVHLLVCDGLEETVCDLLQEGCIDVIVGLEGVGDYVWGHCWGCWGPSMPEGQWHG